MQLLPKPMFPIQKKLIQTIQLIKVVLVIGLIAFSISACERPEGISANNGLSAKQIAEDQKKYTQVVQQCFLDEYPEVENFIEPVPDIALILRAHCLDEFAALRAAMLNYVMVRDVIEPPPKMVQAELDMSMQFVELARHRAKALMNHPPIHPRKNPYTPYHPYKNPRPGINPHNFSYNDDANDEPSSSSKPGF